MMCEPSETCDADGYARDLDIDIHMEHDGTYQVTGDLRPVWTPMVSTCSQ